MRRDKNVRRMRKEERIILMVWNRPGGGGWKETEQIFFGSSSRRKVLDEANVEHPEQIKTELIFLKEDNTGLFCHLKLEPRTNFWIEIPERDGVVVKELVRDLSGLLALSWITFKRWVFSWNCFESGYDCYGETFSSSFPFVFNRIGKDSQFIMLIKLIGNNKLGNGCSEPEKVMQLENNKQLTKLYLKIQRKRLVN